MPSLPRLVRPGPVLAAALLAAAAAAAPAPAAAACPLTTMDFNALTDAPGFTSAAASFDTVAAPGKELGYDVPAGTLRLRHVGKFHTYVRLADTFVVGGLAAGTPVALVAELTVDGTIEGLGCGGSNCWGNLRGTVTRGDDVATVHEAENIFGPAVRPQHFVVTLPLAVVAGTPEAIEFELRGFGAAEFLSTADASFRFVGLPAGATVTSCRGYAAAPTPARAASWGGVKAAYR